MENDITYQTPVYGAPTIFHGAPFINTPPSGKNTFICTRSESETSHRMFLEGCGNLK